MLIESFHAGRSGQRRYCSLHHPSTGLVRATGVVLCHPLGHEYFRSFRAYVRLAVRLAEFGFPVMRFDYTGTGDSEGESGHDRLDDWVRDVVDTADELMQREALSHIALCGMRFGAALAVLAAARIDSARTLFLWDPVEDGARYVDEQMRLHDAMLDDLERFPRSRRKQAREGTEDRTEIVGTHHAASLLEEIRGWRLDDSPRTGDVIVANRHSSAARRSAHTHEFALARDYGWTDRRRIEESIVDPETIHRATTAFSEVAA